MKFILLILSVVTLSSGAFAQDSLKVELNDLVGSWDVIVEDESSNRLVDGYISRTREAEVAEWNNHNNAILKFEDNGTFHLMSINDYSAKDEEGKFEVSKDGSGFVRMTKRPNDFKKSDREKIKKRKSKVLYFDGEVLVLKSERGISYMKKIS